MKNETIKKENSASVAHRKLPPIPEEHLNDGTGTILLFYQYKEPEWNASEHKTVLRKVIELGENHSITGRGRVAPEGLNCTLTGSPQNIRDFCYGLREMDSLFLETDFKLTDGLSKDKLFKSLSIRKTKELVAYGLAGPDKAPSLSKFAGEHLEAEEYHKAMTQKDTVIVDVRNYYESTIGRFAPPPGGAQLLDPKMRNSIEFPKWLNDPSTQKQLNNKTVLMYCTGGIRCERATALLNQMSAAAPDKVKPKAVYELRGGIERYMKTFPEGGFWKGKNYLFDRRMEQLPDSKEQERIENEVESNCCLCQKHWTVYRGKFKCSKGLCGVPVIVCDECRPHALENTKSLKCDLCQKGYKAPQLVPDLVGLKRKAEFVATSLNENAKIEDQVATSNKRNKIDTGSPEQHTLCHDRLFVSKLPLTVNKTNLAESLSCELVTVHWLTDKKTGSFYGSCIVQVKSAANAQKATEKPLKVDKKKIKVVLAKSRQGETWPPADYVEREYPPIGHV